MNIQEILEGWDPTNYERYILYEYKIIFTYHYCFDPNPNRPTVYATNYHLDNGALNSADLILRKIFFKALKLI